MIWVLTYLKDNLHRHSLHHFHVISGGIFRRQQTGAGRSGGSETIYVAAIIAVVSVHVDGSALSYAHVLELIFFVVGHYPDVFQRNQRHERLATLHRLSD